MFVQQIEQAIARMVPIAVKLDNQTSIQEGIILHHRRHVVVDVMVALENVFIGLEFNLCAVGLFRFEQGLLFGHHASAKTHFFNFALAKGPNGKTRRQSIYCLDTNPFNPTDFLKAFESYLAPVFIFDTTSTSLPRGMPRP
jgi:hypothetical protein